MPSSRVTRVGVNDETWQAFRQLALLHGIPVSDYLAKLVDRELARRPESKARLVALHAAPEEQALAALSDARDALLELDDIAGRLARSAYEHGASWKDIVPPGSPNQCQLSQRRILPTRRRDHPRRLLQHRAGSGSGRRAS